MANPIKIIKVIKKATAKATAKERGFAKDNKQITTT